MHIRHVSDLNIFFTVTAESGLKFGPNRGVRRTPFTYSDNGMVRNASPNTSRKEYRMSRSIRVVMLLGALAGAATLASAQEKGKGWSVPKCREIAGTAAVTYTKDDGATLTP